VSIHVGCGDYLLHSLWILPHHCTIYCIKSQVLHIFVSNQLTTGGRLLFPGCSHCTSCIWKVYNCPSCSICQTVLWEKLISNAAQRVLVGLACTASNTSSFCILCLLEPTCASGVNALISLRLCCCTPVCCQHYSLNAYQAFPLQKRYMKCILTYCAISKCSICCILWYYEGSTVQT
jgi:hypothetical protein